MENDSALFIVISLLLKRETGGKVVTVSFINKRIKWQDCCNLYVFILQDQMYAFQLILIKFIVIYIKSYILESYIQLILIKYKFTVIYIKPYILVSYNTMSLSFGQIRIWKMFYYFLTLSSRYLIKKWTQTITLSNVVSQHLSIQQVYK